MTPAALVLVCIVAVPLILLLSVALGWHVSRLVKPVRSPRERPDGLGVIMWQGRDWPPSEHTAKPPARWRGHQGGGA